MHCILCSNKKEWSLINTKVLLLLKGLSSRSLPHWLIKEQSLNMTGAKWISFTARTKYWLSFHISWIDIPWYCGKPSIANAVAFEVCSFIHSHFERMKMKLARSCAFMQSSADVWNAVTLVLPLEFVPDWILERLYVTQFFWVRVSIYMHELRC